MDRDHRTIRVVPVAAQQARELQYAIDTLLGFEGLEAAFEKDGVITVQRR